MFERIELNDTLKKSLGERFELYNKQVGVASAITDSREPKIQAL